MVGEQIGIFDALIYIPFWIALGVVVFIFQKIKSADPEKKKELREWAIWGTASIILLVMFVVLIYYSLHDFTN